MGVRAARQLFLVGLALALWSALGRPGWLELLGCYLAALCLTDLAMGLQVLPSLPVRTWLALALVLALPGLRFAYSARERIIEEAGLEGIDERLGDRLRLARSPVIAPGLLSTAQPQSFFIRAGEAREAYVMFGAQLRLRAQALGPGLFRVDYDPRRDGVPNVLDGELPISIHTDADVASRSLQVVTPLAHPRWFCRSPSGQRAATLSEETDELIVVDAISTKPGRLAVGDGPRSCAFVDEHNVAISHRFASELWVVDLSAEAAGVRKLVLNAPLGAVVFDPLHAELLVSQAGTEPGLVHVPWPELTLRSTSTLALAADQMALSGEAMIIASRSDASLRRLTRQGDHFVEDKLVELGRPATALAVDAGTARVFVSVTDYRPAHSPPQLGNHFVQDQLLIFDAQLNLVQRVLTARRSERQTKAGDMDQGGSPLGIWPMQDGRLALSFAGTDELWRMRLPEAEESSLRFDNADFYAPHGVVELHDGTLWLASAAAGSLAKLSPGASAAVIVPLTSDDRTLASARPLALARRIGERGFYESTRSGISCQSCHMHADSDFAAYNLGDHRLIPTLSVQGLFGTAPYLRDGSYPRLSDLDDVAQHLYRGYVRQQPGRRYALQAYVESLPRSLPQRTVDNTAERRGYAIFQRSGCERCHAPPAFTNLGQLPLAALFPRVAATLTTKEQLDVPSLLSVSTSPPYLHDGRALNLRAVLTEQNLDNLHGDTRDLSAADQTDLLQFLRSL